MPDEAMTHDQLIARLRQLEDEVGQSDTGRRLMAELEVHQVELEMQNRELREAHVQLEESRARLADLYDFAPVVYVTLDDRGRIIEANLTAAALFGIERGKLLGRFLTGIVVDSERNALGEHIRRCFKDRIRVESQLTFVIRGRSPAVAQVASVPVFGPDGDVIGCKTTLTDVTALKRAQEKLTFLAQASAVLGSSFDYRANLVSVARLAVEKVADICIVDLVDAAGVAKRLEVSIADPAKAEQLAPFRAIPARADEGTALGRAIRTKEPLLFPDCSPASLASTGDGFEHEILIKVSGARSMIVVPLLAREAVVGAITLIATESARRYTGTTVATARDLAANAALAIDNARLYERAQRAVLAREDMLSFVSHDLRNPLMGIQLTAELLLKGQRGGEERRRGWKQLERIRRGVQQMRRMIDDLLDISSLDAGRLPFTIGAHDAARMFDDAAMMLAPLAEEKNVVLTFDFEPGHRGDLYIRCDRDRVIQVLSNLIGNAVKFTPAGGAIKIAAGRAGNQALFTVSDSGPGIPPMLRPHIFERYWQAEETARNGRGLGLFIAKGLVEAQGGAIWVDSLAGDGATFSFTLPLASAAEVATLRPTMETTRGSLGPSPIVRSG
jgi:PAS domain S-box-containing protein